MINYLSHSSLSVLIVFVESCVTSLPVSKLIKKCHNSEQAWVFKLVLFSYAANVESSPSRITPILFKGSGSIAWSWLQGVTLSYLVLFTSELSAPLPAR